MLPDLQDGLWKSPCGPEVAHVNLSPLRVINKVSPTNDIYYQLGFDSFGPANLQQLLENRLKTQLPMGGLTKWPMRWKKKITPSGREYSLLARSERRTKEKDFGLWLPTLGANENKGSSKKRYLGSPHFRGAKMSEGLRTCETDPIYLTPSFAAIVMGYPAEWIKYAPSETPSSRKSRRKSSEPTLTQKTSSPDGNGSVK